MPEIFDTVALGDGARVTRDGYLVADARVARVGIQIYLGRELGKPDLATVRVFRPEAEVFSDEAVASFAHRPVTNDHPPELVSAANWKRYARGQTSGDVMRDGDCIRVPLMVADSDAIADVQAGKRELSAGYTCDIAWVPGVTDSGEEYDAVMSQIRGNHVALVRKGRAGPGCRIGDETSEETSNPKGSVNMKTIVVDGVSVELNNEGAAAIAGVLSKLTAASALADAKDGELAALRTAHVAEVADLRTQIPDAAGMDAAIARRAALIEAARKILGDSFDPAGKTEADIRRSAVASRIGDERVAGRSDDYVIAAFDTLTVTAAAIAAPAADPVRAALVRNAPKDAAPSPYAEHVAWLANAHRTSSNEKDA